jgi:SsrA-binding protein
MAATKPVNRTPEVYNRKARYDYEFLETFTAGIQLKGTEVKAIREGKMNLTDAFVTFFGNELTLVDAQISPYSFGTYANHEPRRHRVLLVTKKERERLKSKVQDKGITLVPYKVYFNERGWVKIDFALARGKKSYDKRESIKEREMKRQAERGE